MTKDCSELPFEEAYAELEESVRRLEEGDLRLEEAIALFERAMALVARCQGELEAAELRVSQLARPRAGEQPQGE